MSFPDLHTGSSQQGGCEMLRNSITIKTMRFKFLDLSYNPTFDWGRFSSLWFKPDPQASGSCWPPLAPVPGRLWTRVVDALTSTSTHRGLLKSTILHDLDYCLLQIINLYWSHIYDLKAEYSVGKCFFSQQILRQPVLCHCVFWVHSIEKSLHVPQLPLIMKWSY